MILEIAILNVKPQLKATFEQTFAEASQYIAQIDGYINHSLHQCVEDENRFLLQVRWEKLEDHTIGFRQSEQYQEWKKLLHHYYAPFPIVEHYEMRQEYP